MSQEKIQSCKIMQNEKSEFQAEDKRFKIGISDENILAFINYTNFIGEHLEKRNKVPVKVFKSLISLFETYAPPVENETLKEGVDTPFTSDALKDILENFSGQEYQFIIDMKLIWSPMDPTNENSKNDKMFTALNDQKHMFLKIDFESMVRYILRDVAGKFVTHEKWTKNHCLRQIYLSIEDFSNLYFKKKHHNFFSHYKRSALTTYVAMKMGYKCTHTAPKKGDRYSYKELANFANHAILKIPPEKIRWKANRKKKAR